MASLLTLTHTQPTRSLAPGEVLIAEGNGGGELYVLETGHLIVSRGGVEIARIETPGALIGEMSVLLARTVPPPCAPMAPRPSASSPTPSPSSSASPSWR